jgi:hypothetical protein
MTAMTFATTTPVVPRLRITQRGRVVLGSLIALPLAIVAIVLGLGAGGAVATKDATDVSYTWVTVSAGESLWDLAAEFAPMEDPREFAAQVASLNQLASATVQPGQELAIPAQYAD